MADKKGTYQDWINEHVPEYKDAYGKCKEVTVKMIVAFPELQRVCGFYMDPAWGQRDHWWCKTITGTVIDPTAKQFPSAGAGEYIEYDGRPLRTGPCINCGADCFNGDSVCSPECHDEVAAEFNSILRKG